MNEQRKTQRSWIWFFFSRGALIYLALVFLLMLFQRHFIYFPSRSREDELLRAAERDGLLPWRDRENQLIGWRSPMPGNQVQPIKRLVVFHGNGGYALHRSYYVDGFRSVSPGNWEVLIFEYPGYGARPGTPGEDTIVDAGRKALSELSQDGSPAYLLGESLGSGVASRLAAENPKSVAGLFLVTPFTRLADVASSHYRIFPVRLLLRERYEVQGYLNDYPGPVAFLMAGRDEIIPANLGQHLYEQRPGPKKLWIQPEAGHNTLDFSPRAPWWQEVADFLATPSK